MFYFVLKIIVLGLAAIYFICGSAYFIMKTDEIIKRREMIDEQEKELLQLEIKRLSRR
jgi:hypothetical protein